MRTTRVALLAMALGATHWLPSFQAAATTIFNSRPLQQERFVVLAQAVGGNRWKLVVLEQIKAQPRCWTRRPDGLVEPSLNQFNFSGICKRYLDSNGYSLRSGKEDLAHRYRLRIEQTRTGLELRAITAAGSRPITVAKAHDPQRNREAFVQLKLEPGWDLEQRTYQGRNLNHVYFANPDPINLLIAKAANRHQSSGFNQLGMPLPPPPIPTIPKIGRSKFQGKGPIRLVVIPYRPGNKQYGRRTVN
ncbi:MAG: DUF3747 domain-containing protein [Prochlorococcaceae cyanobacterium ETNP18_MAG_1]|nr:DUF3747 domain-containing protein [Prochlorococcaceae cyanobacterium ETNP18_MAG_1]